MRKKESVCERTKEEDTSPGKEFYIYIYDVITWGKFLKALNTTTCIMLSNVVTNVMDDMCKCMHVMRT